MKKKMIITRGFPASGKTTWAKSWIAEAPDTRINVCRDDIRAMMGFSGVGNGDQEDMVTAIAESMIFEAGKQEKSVVISDTNLPAQRVRGFAEMGMKHGFDVSVKDFVEDINVIIKRDSERPDSVGEKVIRDMYSRFPYKSWASGDAIVARAKERVDGEKFAPIRQAAGAPEAVVFDVDGTLAHMGDRSPYDFDSVGEDTVNENVAEIVRMIYHRGGKRVFIFSGREDVCRDATEKWLKDNNIPYDELHMRASGDNRRDSIVKREMIESVIVGRYYVTHWFDDRNQVVDMVRATFADTPTMCFQVNEGDF